MADNPNPSADDPVPGPDGDDPNPDNPTPSEPPPDEEPKDELKDRDAPGEPTPKQEPGEGDDPPKETDWRANIDDPKVKKFADRFSDPADAAKTAFEFRQKLSNAVSIPGKNASEEDVAEFHKQLGVPESADGYTVEMPDDMPEFVDTEKLGEGMEAFKQKMHEVGARPEVVQAAAEWYLSDVKQQSEQITKQYEQSYNEAQSTLKKEWGDEYDANVEYANRGAKQFGDDDFTDLIKNATYQGVPVGNHPAFLRAFSKVGRRMGEGGMQLAMGEDEQQETKDKMEDLTKRAHEAQEKGDRTEANKLFRQRDDLAKRYYGQE